MAGYAAEERYADTVDRGQERYGGGAGGERYGIGVLLYGEVDDGYWTLLNGDDRYAGPVGAARYKAAGSGRYPDVASVVEEFGIDWEYT